MPDAPFPSNEDLYAAMIELTSAVLLIERVIMVSANRDVTLWQDPEYTQSRRELREAINKVVNRLNRVHESSVK